MTWVSGKEKKAGTVTGAANADDTGAANADDIGKNFPIEIKFSEQIIFVNLNNTSSF